MAKIRLAVLFGGASQDYAASLRSAHAVLCALPRDRYDIIPIGITRAGRWLFFPGDYDEIPGGEWEQNADNCSAVISPDPHHGGILKILDDGGFAQQRIDAVLPILHGKYGECGRIQALCRLAGVLCIGSGFEASNACTDLALTYLLLMSADITVPAYFIMEREWLDNIEQYYEKIESRIKYPMYVRASSCSNSISANIACDREELKTAIKLAATHHHKVVIRQNLEGRMLECAVTGGGYSRKTSVVGESGVSPVAGEISAAQLDEAISRKIIETATKAFTILGCKDFALFSFTLTDKCLYLRKASAMPGFSQDDVFPSLMKLGGIEYTRLLEMIIEDSM